jgi:hypothetical protein
MVFTVVVEVKPSHKMRGFQKHESKTTPAALGKYHQFRKWSLKTGLLFESDITDKTLEWAPWYLP